MQGLMLHAGAKFIGRQDLLALPTPDSTETHKPIAHSRVIGGIIEALAYRKLEIAREEYGVTPDGMCMFGFIEVNVERDGIRLGIAVRNANNKAFALGLVAGYRTFICDNRAFRGEFFAVTRRHSKALEAELQDVLAIGVDRVQRQFEPMLAQVDAWKNHQLPDIQAKELIYNAFVREEIDAPKHLMRDVDRLYFEPEYEEFKPRTVYSMQNAFTSAFQKLDPIPMYRATSSAGEYFAAFS
jgi:hypothetical protein